MSILRDTTRALRVTAVLWLVTAILYPLLMLAIGQFVFPFQANGSLIKNAQGTIAGSALIGQPFAGDRYFNGRPSTSNYSTADPQQDTAGILKTGISSASNLAPSNPALLERIQGKASTDPKAAIAGDLPKWQAVGIQPPADLLYSSGSSLDPHISPEAAIAQRNRVANARGLSPQQIEGLISQNIEGRFLGIFGEPGVNVLKLNLALDAVTPS